MTEPGGVSYGFISPLGGFDRGKMANLATSTEPPPLIASSLPLQPICTGPRSVVMALSPSAPPACEKIDDDEEEEEEEEGQGKWMAFGALQVMVGFVLGILFALLLGSNSRRDEQAGVKLNVSSSLPLPLPLPPLHHRHDIPTWSVEQIAVFLLMVSAAVVGGLAGYYYRGRRRREGGDRHG